MRNRRQVKRRRQKAISFLLVTFCAEAHWRAEPVSHGPGQHVALSPDNADPLAPPWFLDKRSHERGHTTRRL